MGEAVSNLVCPFTGSTDFEKVFTYTEKPPREIAFSFTKDAPYHREIWRCRTSGHYLSIHSMPLDHMYDEDYVAANYGDIQGIHKTFQRIMGLPAGDSDNAGRIQRINQFSQQYFGSIASRSVLDVGSGLGVFPFGMKKDGWDVTALDPDRRSHEHIESMLKMPCILGHFGETPIDERFDLITFNKVLEHIEDPVSVLSMAKKNLKKRGLVYVELPDGEMAARDGADREEFTIDHIHVFSFASMTHMIQKSGFDVLSLERLQEPSTKYTLRAFIQATPTNGGRSHE